MKALVVAPYYHPNIGGVENYARQLALALNRAEQWQIVIVTSNHSRRSHTERVDGFMVYRLASWFKISNTPFNVWWPVMIRRIIDREQPDVILAHAPVPSLADAAVRAAGRTPFVLVYHAATLIKQGSHVFNILARIYGVYSRPTFDRANQIWAVSEFVKGQFSEKIQRKTIVVPNAVWEAEIISRSQPRDTNFIFIGSLNRSHAWKGLSAILRAFSIYSDRYGRDATLTIVGDGTNRSVYEAQAAELGLSKQVRFVGAQTGKDKMGSLRTATALIVYPTTDNDAFPTVILEAWASHVPVIAAAIGPMPSLLHDHIDSYLVAPHHPEQLAEAMYQVARSPLTSRSRLADRAAARARHNYTWERQATLVTETVANMLQTY